jgi:hypothetical protein
MAIMPQAFEKRYNFFSPFSLHMIAWRLLLTQAGAVST